MPADKHSRRSAAVEDRHRVAIDEGRAGDKVDQPDPAAAPMGTDAEAGGSSTDQKAAHSDFAA